MILLLLVMGLVFFKLGVPTGAFLVVAAWIEVCP
jgi:hypothetical protein